MHNVNIFQIENSPLEIITVIGLKINHMKENINDDEYLILDAPKESKLHMFDKSIINKYKSKNPKIPKAIENN